jgi:hypothetical protein
MASYTLAANNLTASVSFGSWISCSNSIADEAQPERIVHELKYQCVVVDGQSAQGKSIGFKNFQG